VAELSFRIIIRSRSFVILSLLAAIVTGLGTIPFSPGIRAGTVHYLEAGVSTLLLGGVVVCLAAVPRAFNQGGARFRSEAVHALPLSPTTLVVGTFSGSACAVALYFLVCGGVYLAVAGAGMDEADGVLGPDRLILAVLHALLLVWICAALVLALHSILPSVTAFVTALFLIVAGQFSLFFPPLPGLILPPFDVLDPARVLVEAPGEARPAGLLLLHGAAGLVFYLWLAVILRISTDSRHAGSG